MLLFYASDFPVSHRYQLRDRNHPLGILLVRDTIPDEDAYVPRYVNERGKVNLKTHI